jgi:hypothetical protein
MIYKCQPLILCKLRLATKKNWTSNCLSSWPSTIQPKWLLTHTNSSPYFGAPAKRRAISASVMGGGEVDRSCTGSKTSSKYFSRPGHRASSVAKRVDSPARGLHQISGGSLELLFAQRDVEGTFQNVEGFFLPVVDVRWRTGPGRHNRLHDEIGSVALGPGYKKRVSVARSPVRRAGAGR